MMRAEDFVEIFSGQPAEKSPPKLGIIPADYVSGRPRVKFDNDDVASSRTYPYLSSYTPAAGDRVLVITVGHGAVVLGKII